jgi:predicted nucleotidyltransferase component of viral defense system
MAALLLSPQEGKIVYSGNNKMNSTVEKMLARYSLVTRKDHENALKEIVQEIVLLGLQRAKFFEKAAFYGGTALRIIYGLPRFSEDLDFTLYKPDPAFRLDPYFSAMETELNAFGFEVSVERVDKKIATTTESAFVKANTKIHFLKIKSLAKFAAQTQSNEKLQIKFEVDIDPAVIFQSESKFLFQPVGFSIVCLREPDLFAGKLHAFLYRKWKNRIKGRDYYDYAWHLSNKTPLRFDYFLEKAIQSGHLKAGEISNLKDLKTLISKHLKNTDFEKAKTDVEPFIKNQNELEAWGLNYFLAVTDRLELI